MKRITKIDAVTNQIKKKLRVAAYCRVSTDSDAQLESLDAQKSHYERYISARDDWEFAGLYFDQGITGTSAEKRLELMRLIKDCEDGKIDFVITKSISRFSRNTTDCLELVRKLLDIGVPIFFEKENINTGSMESELFLAILSSMSQDESSSISLNSKWSVKNRFQNGTFKIGYPPYGYDWNGEEMVINVSQSEVVKRIFADVLSGKGTKTIADKLNADGIPTKKGGRWTATTINGMLKNEKYTGDVIFQKSYSDSNFKRHINNGERDQYMVADHHEAIISHEDFDAVATLLSQRANEKGIVSGMAKYQNRYAFSGKIVCGECFDTFKRRTHSCKENSYIAWCCNTHIENKEQCSMKYIRDDDLQLAFITMMNKLIFAHKLILKPLLETLKESGTDRNLQRSQEIQTLLLKNKEQRETLTRLMTSGYIDKIVYTKENNELLMQAENYRRETQLLAGSATDDNAKVSELNSLLRFAEKANMLLCFDEELFSRHVNRIIVYSRQEVGFELKCGLVLRERM